MVIGSPKLTESPGQLNIALQQAQQPTQEQIVTQQVPVPRTVQDVGELSKFQDNPKYTVTENPDGSFTVKSKPQEYIYNESGSDVDKRTFVRESYKFDSGGNFVEGKRKDLRVSINRKNRYAERPYDEVIYKTEGEVIEKTTYETVEKSSGAETVKLMEKEVAPVAGGGFELVESRTNLTPTQKFSRGELARDPETGQFVAVGTPGSELSVAAQKKADIEGRFIDEPRGVVKEATELETVSASVPFAVFAGEPEKERPLPSAIRERAEESLLLTMPQVLESPEQQALVLGVSEQQVKGSAGFRTLRARRLAEVKAKITEPTETEVGLAGGKIILTGTVTPFSPTVRPSDTALATPIKTFLRQGLDVDVQGKTILVTDKGVTRLIESNLETQRKIVFPPVSGLAKGDRPVFLETSRFGIAEKDIATVPASAKVDVGRLSLITEAVPRKKGGVVGVIDYLMQPQRLEEAELFFKPVTVKANQLLYDVKTSKAFTTTVTGLGEISKFFRTEPITTKLPSSEPLQKRISERREELPKDAYARRALLITGETGLSAYEYFRTKSTEAGLIVSGGAVFGGATQALAAGKTGFAIKATQVIKSTTVPATLLFGGLTATEIALAPDTSSRIDIGVERGLQFGLFVTGARIGAKSGLPKQPKLSKQQTFLSAKQQRVAKVKELAVKGVTQGEKQAAINRLRALSKSPNTETRVAARAALKSLRQSSLAFAKDVAQQKAINKIITFDKGVVPKVDKRLSLSIRVSKPTRSLGKDIVLASPADKQISKSLFFKRFKIATQRTMNIKALEKTKLETSLILRFEKQKLSIAQIRKASNIFYKEPGKLNVELTKSFLATDKSVKSVIFKSDLKAVIDKIPFPRKMFASKGAAVKGRKRFKTKGQKAKTEIKFGLKGKRVKGQIVSYDDKANQFVFKRGKERIRISRKEVIVSKKQRGDLVVRDSPLVTVKRPRVSQIFEFEKGSIVGIRRQIDFPMQKIKRGQLPTAPKSVTQVSKSKKDIERFIDTGEGIKGILLLKKEPKLSKQLFIQRTEPITKKRIPDIKQSTKLLLKKEPKKLPQLKAKDLFAGDVKFKIKGYRPAFIEQRLRRGQLIPKSAQRQLEQQFGKPFKDIAKSYGPRQTTEPITKPTIDLQKQISTDLKPKKLLDVKDARELALSKRFSGVDRLRQQGRLVGGKALDTYQEPKLGFDSKFSLNLGLLSAFVIGQTFKSDTQLDIAQRKTTIITPKTDQVIGFEVLQDQEEGSIRIQDQAVDSALDLPQSLVTEGILEKPVEPLTEEQEIEVIAPIIIPSRPIIDIPTIEPPIQKQVFKPEEPRTKLFEFKRPQKIKGVKGKEAYNVQVKDKGSFIKVNKKPLPFNKARNLGAKVVDETPSASFKLVKQKKKTLIKDDTSYPLKMQFRPSKTNPNIIVEKRKYRINTPGEVQGISVKGYLGRLRKTRWKAYI